jgi:hypothetical protein
MLVIALILANAVFCAAGCWVVLRALAAMSRGARESVRWAFIAKSAGQAVQIAAAADYFIGDPRAWPWLLLSGVALSNLATALLFHINRRACDAAECVYRRMFWCSPR